MTPEFVLHAGLAPTDGPMLHRALARLRPQLRRRGVAAVTPPDFRNLTDLPAAVAAERDATRRCRAVLVSFPTVALRRDLSAAGAPRRVAAALAAIGADGPARVSLTVARPDRLYELAYLDLVARGETRPPGAVLTGVPDLADLADRIAALPAVGALTIRPWELVGAGAVAYVDDLLDLVGLRGELDLRRLARRFSAGRRYSAAALPVATALLPLAGTDEQRADLRRLVFTHFGASAEADTRFLDPAERANLLARHRPGNRDLLRRYRPDLPAGAYDDDAGTAALAGVLEPIELPWPPARNSRPDLARRAKRRAYRRWQRLTAAG
jgi:hypothetical protein